MRKKRMEGNYNEALALIHKGGAHSNDSNDSPKHKANLQYGDDIDIYTS